MGVITPSGRLLGIILELRKPLAVIQNPPIFCNSNSNSNRSKGAREERRSKGGEGAREQKEQGRRGAREEEEREKQGRRKTRRKRRRSKRKKKTSILASKMSLESVTDCFGSRNYVYKLRLRSRNAF